MLKVNISQRVDKVDTLSRRTKKFVGKEQRGRRRQPHRLNCAPYVGACFVGGFDIGVACQIKDLGNTASTFGTATKL